MTRTRKRSIATIACPRCGAGAEVNLDNKVRQTDVDIALRVIRRVRVCKCGEQFGTTELPSGELADLRRRAYLYERTVGSASE